MRSVFFYKNKKKILKIKKSVSAITPSGFILIDALDNDTFYKIYI